MMSKKYTLMFAVPMVLGAMASTVAMADAPFAPYTGDLTDPYIMVHPVDASSINGGSFNLRGYEPGTNPEMLGLHIDNPTPNPVNVRIPDLRVSYLVPANTERVVYLNMLAVGVHQEVPYTTEAIVPTQVVEADTTDITQIINSNSNYNYPDKPEPVYSAPSKPSAVRGYW